MQICALIAQIISIDVLIFIAESKIFLQIQSAQTFLDGGFKLNLFTRSIDHPKMSEKRDSGSGRESLSRKSRKSVLTLKKNEELSAQYDYVMVFPMEGEPGSLKQTKTAKFAVEEMNKAGLETFSYLSVQDDELIVLVRCPVSAIH